MDSPECREKQNCLDWCSTLTMLRSFGSTPHAGCWLVTTRKTNYIFRLRDPESNLHLQLLLSGVRSNHWVGKVGKCRLLIHARSSPKKKKAQWNPVMEMWGVYFPLERSSLKNSFAQLNRSKITFLIPSRKPKTKQILKSYILQSHPIKTSIQNQNTLVGIKSYLNLVDGVPS